MRSIISGLMSYSVAREGELSISEFCIGEVIDEVCESRSSAAIATGRPLPVVTVAPGRRVLADRPLVTQVLDDLLGNAAKYTHPGQRAEIEVCVEGPADGWVTVTVADRGIGLPPGQENAVFAEFHRVPEHRGAYLGIGLGPSICKRIIERHGGWIIARPRLGGGSEFVLTLLAAPVEAEEAAGGIRAIEAHRLGRRATPARPDAGCTLSNCGSATCTRARASPTAARCRQPNPLSECPRARMTRPIGPASRLAPCGCGLRN